jgi:ABC-type branched-subunit amino acid transport system substrate-binding protein
MRQFHFVGLILLVGLALAVHGCAGVGGPEPAVSPEQQRAYDAAVAMLASDPEATEMALENFLRDHGHSALADDAAEKLAQLALQRSDVERAVFWFNWVLRHYDRGGRADAVRLNLARLELERGHRDAADRALRGLRYRRLSNEQKRVAYRLRVDLAESSVEKLRWLEQARTLIASTSRDERSLLPVDAEIDALLAGMSREQLERALDQLDRRIPAGRASLYAAAADMNAGDWERATEELAAIEDFELTPADRELLARLTQRLQFHERAPGLDVPLPSFAEVARKPPLATRGATGTIGVVLPLSGTYARFGQESLRGVLLAARIFEPQQLEWGEDAVRADELGRLPPVDAGYDSFGQEQPSDIASAPLAQIGELRIAVRDSAGDPERAARAVRELARDENAVAIIGPLLFRESEAAARVADEEGIPLLCLTSREEVSRDRPYVLRLRTTPEDELGFLVAYASEQLGAERFAVLYPDDNYGRGMRDRFWQAVGVRGGYVVAAAAYDPTATDFAEPIRRMIGYQLLNAVERKALAERDRFLRRGRRLPPESAALVPELAARITGPDGEPLPPIVDFDALFIPDSHDKIVLIAPQLAFHELTGVQLLGSDGWNHPELLEIAREHVSGAVISALFDVNSPFPFVARFVDDYISTFGVSPNVYSAHGFDAVNLVLVQLAAGVEGSSQLLDAVLETRGYPGVSGVMTLLPDGNARKRPFLLEVRGRGIAPLD